jgi:two-component system response regulator NreC
MAMIRVLLVDDHALMRAALRALLEAEADITVVGEAATGEEGVVGAAGLRPDVVVMDLSMPGAGGFEAIRRIAEQDSGARTLVLSVDEPDERVLEVLEAGGSGYVTKRSAADELVAAIRGVAAGDTHLCPAAARYVVDRYRRAADPRSCPDPLDALSGREVEVLRQTARGFSAPEIAGQLGISPKTVDSYRHRISAKLGLHHRSELVRFALRVGLLAG